MIKTKVRKLKRHMNNSLKKPFKIKSGFTLIELILVIAILGVISGIGIPKFSGFIQTSRLSADQATVENLNKATPLARMTSSTDDLFLDEDESSEDLLAILVSDGYFTDDIKPQSKGGKFKWILGDEKWCLVFEDSSYVITLSDGFTIDDLGGHRGMLKGSYTGSLKDIFILGSINGIDIKGIYSGKNIEDFMASSVIIYPIKERKGRDDKKIIRIYPFFICNHKYISNNYHTCRIQS